MGGKKVTEEEISRMNQLYNEGYSLAKIGRIIGRPDTTVSKYVEHEPGIKQNFYKQFSEEEFQEILDLYADRKWDEIFEKFPKLKNKKHKIYTLASDRKIGVNNYFWTQEDIDLLKENHGKKSYEELEKLLKYKYTKKAIGSKAKKLGLTESQDWTEEEIQIMLKYYSTIPKNEFQQMLPNRTENAIVGMGRKLGIKSYHYLQEKYSEEQKQFILDHYKYMTDQEMADILGKTPAGISAKRNELGIYYINREYRGYESVSKFLRGHIQNWKNRSMENCDYRCILTGCKEFKIHHIYSFNMIVKETFEILDEEGLLVSNCIDDYTKEELDYMLEIFSDVHEKYPLGVCLRDDIHNLFHKIYGSGGNTIEQWSRFKEDFLNHKYDDELAS